MGLGVARQIHIKASRTTKAKLLHSKELYNLPGTETFAEEPRFGKLLRELQSTPVRCY